MDLAEALRNYREKIVDNWVEYTLSTYASSAFFLKEKDKFANPVGSTIRESLMQIFRLLEKNSDINEYKPSVERIIQIRAIQEFSPSQAVAPLNAVKHITREFLAADKERALCINDLYDFEFSVDLIVLAAFDKYMEFRERLYKTRIEEIKTGRSVLADSRCPSKMAEIPVVVEQSDKV